jgi:microcystin-dependent protein
MKVNIDKVDFTNPKTLTIIIIVLLLIFALVYVWNNRKNTVEGFAQYNINSSDLVSLYGMDNVVVGSSNPISLGNQINTMIDNRNKNLNSQYVGISDFNSLKNNVSSNASSLLNTINVMNTLRQNLTDDLTMITQMITSNVNIMNTTLNSNVALMNSTIPPPFSIMAFYSTTIPAGWQICNGDTLLCIDGITKVYCTFKNAITEFKTPNLLGRTIIGGNIKSTDRYNVKNINDKYLVGELGGAERHTLNVSEIPSHNHGAYTSYWGAKFFNLNEGSRKAGLMTGYWKPNIHQDYGIYEEADVNNNPYVGYRGGGAPHNNMQPYFVLCYIIKQPPLSMGGLSNPLPTIPEKYNANE